jgi:20S proteasome alpha/beta subunit
MAMFDRPPTTLEEPTSAPLQQYVQIPCAYPRLSELTNSRFDPYDDNGGTILAIAGKDFTVIAGDTRQAQGYSIQTRYARKVFQL